MTTQARDRDISAWAEKLRAVAHPVRLKIVIELLDGMKCVNDIRELTDARQPNVSQHLRVLRHGGLVDYEKRGTSRCYFLTSRPLIHRLLALLQREQPPARIRGRPTGRRVRRQQSQRRSPLRPARLPPSQA